MSDRLPSLSRRKVVRALGRAGFVFNPSGGKGGHGKLFHPTRGKVTYVPSARDVPTGTLKSILSQAGLTREEFLALL